MIIYLIKNFKNLHHRLKLLSVLGELFARSFRLAHSLNLLSQFRLENNISTDGQHIIRGTLLDIGHIFLDQLVRQCQFCGTQTQRRCFLLV